MSHISRLPLQEMIAGVVQNATAKLASEDAGQMVSDEIAGYSYEEDGEEYDEDEEGWTDPNYVEKLASACDFIATNVNYIAPPNRGVLGAAIEKLSGVPMPPVNPAGALEADASIGGVQPEPKVPSIGKLDAAVSQTDSPMGTAGLPAGKTQMENDMNSAPGQESGSVPTAEYPPDGPLHCGPEKIASIGGLELLSRMGYEIEGYNKEAGVSAAYKPIELAARGVRAASGGVRGAAETVRDTGRKFVGEVRNKPYVVATSSRSGGQTLDAPTLEAVRKARKNLAIGGGSAAALGTAYGAGRAGGKDKKAGLEGGYKAIGAIAGGARRAKGAVRDAAEEVTQKGRKFVGEVRNKPYQVAKSPRSGGRSYDAPTAADVSKARKNLAIAGGSAAALGTAYGVGRSGKSKKAGLEGGYKAIGAIAGAGRRAKGAVSGAAEEAVQKGRKFVGEVRNKPYQVAKSPRSGGRSYDAPTKAEVSRARKNLAIGGGSAAALGTAYGVGRSGKTKKAGKTQQLVRLERALARAKKGVPGGRSGGTAYPSTADLEAKIKVVRKQVAHRAENSPLGTTGYTNRTQRWQPPAKPAAPIKTTTTPKPAAKPTEEAAKPGFFSRNKKKLMIGGGVAGTAAAGGGAAYAMRKSAAEVAREAILRKLAGEDVMTTNISGGEGSGGPLVGDGELDVTQSGKNLSYPTDGSGYGNEARRLINSNAAAMGYTKPQAKKPQVPQLGQVLGEVANSSAHTSNLNEQLRNAGAAGVKIAGGSREILKQAAARGIINQEIVDHFKKQAEMGMDSGMTAMAEGDESEEELDRKRKLRALTEKQSGVNCR